MRRSIAFILLIVVFNSNAQLPADIKFTNYTRAEGLPEETINNIIQDSRGFIWIGSKEGLIRFDGLHFKAWYADPGDSSKFNNNNITLLAEYKPGYILFLSGSNLWQIDLSNHRFSPINWSKGKTMTGGLAKLADGEWCFTDMDSIYIINSSFNVASSLLLKNYYPPNTPLILFPLHHPYVMLQSLRINRTWLLNYVTKKITPITIDDSQLDSRSRFFSSGVYDSSRKRLYLSAYFNGNFYCDLNLPSVTTYKPVYIDAQKDGAIRKSILSPGNKMIQVGDNGLFIIDFTKNISFDAKSFGGKPVASNTVLDIFHAKDGSYWIATLHGISRFTLDKPIIQYGKSNSDTYKNDEFKFVTKANDDNLYLLSQSNSLLRMNKSTGVVQRLDSGLTYCWSAVQSGKEIIFTGSGKRLGIYNIVSGKMSYPTFLQPFYTKNTDIVTLVFKAKNGDLWYSCNGSGGLIRNAAGTDQYIQYSRNSSPPSFSHSYVHTAAEDSHGNIWWASNKTQMLLKWNAQQQRFEEYGVDKLIPQYKLQTGINNLFMDPNDNLWIALDGSALLKYNVNSKTGSYYDINKGLPTDAVWGMCSDAKNRLWFGTRKGLCCYLYDKDKVITFTSYDGLPEDDFDGNAVFYDKKENLVYASARQSIAYFDPDTLLGRAITSRPKVYVDEMLVNGKPFYFENTKNISLLTKENNIEFRFASPDFNRNNQLLFQYRLKGASNEWIDLGDRRSVTFNNLQHGEYSLSVRCNYRGTETWTETEFPFSFIIATPWYKTWWFRGLAFVTVVFFAWYFIRSYYRRKLEKQKTEAEKIRAVEKERTRIATDMHDDFGASLSRIKFISEKMQLTETDNEKLKSDLVKISSYSDEMAEKMNEIVWALNQRYDSVEDLVSFSRAYAADYLGHHNIRLQFKANHSSDRKIHGEVRRNIFMVIKESLHNIVKHAGASEVTIEFKQHPQNLDVIIKDNGRGIDLDAIRPFANGLENMKKRMADIDGLLKIKNETGTEIRISAGI